MYHPAPMSDTPTPTEIKLHQKSRLLEVAFSDGHSTGIYSWDYLYSFGTDQNRLWAEYLGKLAAAGSDRNEKEGPTAAKPNAGKGRCG